MSANDEMRRDVQVESRWERPLIAEREGVAHLLVLVTAPAAEATERSPLDLVFVLDRSGSMAGEPLALVKQAASFAAGLLGPQDRLGLVVYDNEVEVLHRPVPCTPQAIGRFRGVLQGVRSGGSTDLGGGWLAGCEALAQVAATAGEARVRRTLLLTDGLANHGITDPSTLMRHAGELRKRGISTTTMGVGASFDELLLAGMAEAGGGQFAYVSEPSELRAFFSRELGDLLRVRVTGLRVGFRFPRGLRVHLVNPYPVSYASGRIDVAVGDLPDGDLLPLLFRIEAEDAAALGSELPLDLRAAWQEPATGRAGRHEWRETLRVARDEVVEATTPAAEVAEHRAILEASRLQREAIRLDREGRYAERAAYFDQARQVMACVASPSLAESLDMMADLDQLDGLSAAAPMAPDLAKRTVASAFSRSRRRGR